MQFNTVQQLQLAKMYMYNTFTLGQCRPRITFHCKQIRQGRQTNWHKYFIVIFIMAEYYEMAEKDKDREHAKNNTDKKKKQGK